MCLLAIANQVVPEFPLVIAANRDEYFARPTARPAPLDGNPVIVAGRDLRSGGTWLGVNQYGLTAAVTNRHSGPSPDPALPSRGLLCIKALQATTFDQACSRVSQRLTETRMNPFNLLLATVDMACIFTDLNCQPQPLDRGWHVLGNQLVDAQNDPRVQRTFSLINRGREKWRSLKTLVPLLKDICRDHGTQGGAGATNALCVHGVEAGTRSSTILAVHEDRTPALYLYADDAPCRAPYTSIILPWESGHKPGID